MSNPVNLDPRQVEVLLQSLAQQMGCSPESLRQQLQSGNISGITSSMGESGRQVQQLLKDPRQLQQAMNSPQMRELLRRIQGQK